LNSTNLTGAFSSPAPPDSFRSEQRRRRPTGQARLLWRRPAATGEPALVSASNAVFSRTWLAKDRIVPQLDPQIGKTHALKKALTRVTDQNFVNSAWSGAGVRGGKWTGIIGFWKIPTVSEPSEPRGEIGGWDSSSWIGLDGFDIDIVSNDVLQAGRRLRTVANQ
jgi:hypothetical protein